jgi:GntR family transcriptional regulator
METGMETGRKMLFQVKPNSGVPIYRQLIEQVNRLVVSGHLKPGDELPSVRMLAQFLEVNQMTISKAYSLLEATGVLERKRGKRMAVAANQAETRGIEKRMSLIRPTLMEAVSQTRQLGLPKESVINEFKTLLEDEQ